LESIPVESWKSPGRVLEESWKSPGRVLPSAEPFSIRGRRCGEGEKWRLQEEGWENGKKGGMEAGRHGGREAGRECKVREGGEG